MEPKFKTFYKGALIDCEISTAENLVFIKQGTFFGAVGRYKDAGVLDGGLPLMPLFHYTSKNAKNGGIYCGHLVRTPASDLILLEIFWNYQRAGYSLRDNGRNQVYEFDDPIFYKEEELEIVGHISMLKVYQNQIQGEKA